MISPIIEAALRSVLVAVAVWTGLRIFRVRNVVAEKAAWGLVLASALLMPLLLPYAASLPGLPSSAMLVLPTDPDTLLGEIRAQMRPEPVAQPSAQSPQQPLASAAPVISNLPRPEAVDEEDSTSSLVSAPSIAARTLRTEVISAPAFQASALSRLRSRPWNRFAFLLYAAVAGFMALRLAFGLFRAFRIWLAAHPVSLNDAAIDLRLRSSRAVSSPVTIGSSVILPADYKTWDIEKLRIVLAHERSHIRQGDFYLQLLAGLYAAFFWFSPLGWWLKSKLSDLAEAISDRAGLQQAASRSSYAQILLEFAAAPRPTLIGVAMARNGSISRRIERLLNDTSFRQAFAGTRRRALVAVLLVPVALFVATTMIKVQAASQAPGNVPNQSSAQASPQPAASAEPEAPISGVSTPENPSDAPEPKAGQAAPPAPGATQTPPSAPGASAAPETAPPTPAIPGPEGTPAVAPLPPLPPVGPVKHTTISRSFITHDSQENGSSYRYSIYDDGQSWGLVRGDQHVHFSGDLHSGDIEKIRKLAHGDFLWFNRDGKSYFVDDPATLQQIEDLYKPMELLGKQQEDLGRQQRELGNQQRELAHQQSQATVSAPDISKEVAEINAAMAKLQALSGKTVTQAELADVQRKLGELQGKLGGLQGQMGAKQGEFGAKMGALGAEQGKLGAQQGRLGAEQGRLAHQADEKVKSIIDQSMQNGKAHPVD